jgi:hypothetical protein
VEWSTYLTIGGIWYANGAGAGAPPPGVAYGCPQGVHVAAGSTITWTIVGIGGGDLRGWEICF